MWATLQDQSFLLGAVLVTLVHATKFGELNLANPVTAATSRCCPVRRSEISSDLTRTTSHLSRSSVSA
jgi:hypothetical protein